VRGAFGVDYAPWSGDKAEFDQVAQAPRPKPTLRFLASVIKSRVEISAVAEVSTVFAGWLGIYVAALRRFPHLYPIIFTIRENSDE